MKKGYPVYFYLRFKNDFLKRARRTNCFVANRTISYGRKQTSEEDFPELPVVIELTRAINYYRISCNLLWALRWETCYLSNFFCGKLIKAIEREYKLKCFGDKSVAKVSTFWKAKWLHYGYDMYSAITYLIIMLYRELYYFHFMLIFRYILLNQLHQLAFSSINNFVIKYFISIYLFDAKSRKSSR
jgi:hypothetical protein